jgi:hypothetical protein
MTREEVIEGIQIQIEKIYLPTRKLENAKNEINNYLLEMKSREVIYGYLIQKITSSELEIYIKPTPVIFDEIKFTLNLT